MLSTKHKIIRNFDKKASTYEAGAQVQARVAWQLAHRLEGLQPEGVLEIGCGTGLLSQHLIQLFPEASLLITDVSLAMLQQCQQWVASHRSIDFMCMDGEQFALSKQYDLIVSSMTLHWFMDLQRSCIDITNQLERGGQFVFSILGENSFKEWRMMCQQFNLPIATPLFPAEHLLQTMLPNVELEVETYQQTYSSAYAFLSSLKTIGAIAPRMCYSPLPSGQLRQVLRRFNSEITISYEVIYGKYTRK